MRWIHLALPLLLSACQCVTTQVLESPQVTAAPPVEHGFFIKPGVNVTQYEKIVYL